MTEYIDREAALDAVDADNLHRGIVAALQSIIAEIPAADVKPVVKGKWEWDDDGMDWGLGSWRCSRCHVRPETTWQTKKDIVPLRWSGSKFCPNCGADMREG